MKTAVSTFTNSLPFGRMGTEARLPHRVRQDVRRCCKVVRPVVPQRVPRADRIAIAEKYHEQSLMDMWMAVEDLWLRVARLLPCSVHQVHGCYEVRFLGSKGLNQTSDTRGLLDAMCNGDSYRWSMGGNQGSLVQWMDCTGDDLVLQIPSFKQLERWEGGSEMALMLQSLLVRMVQGRAL